MSAPVESPAGSPATESVRLAGAGLNIAACPLCRWIGEDLVKNGRLTDNYPKLGPAVTRARVPWAGGPMFPVRAKLDHMILEKIFLDKTSHARIVAVE